jgi:clan AA aspartic protease (TIGR02281 family)
MDEPNCITIRSLSLDSRKPTQYENSVSKICNLRAWDSYSIDRLYNAFQYLFITMKESSKFNRGGDDPFAQTIYDKIENQIESKSSNEVIPLLSNNGVYEIWVKLGAIKKKFVLDSGASDITISNEVEKELINLGVIKKENYSSPALYRIADGSIISCRRITLPSLTVGKFTIKNVTVSVSNSMLLGKGFLDKFSRWTINNNSKSLELER